MPLTLYILINTLDPNNINTDTKVPYEELSFPLPYDIFLFILKLLYVLKALKYLCTGSVSGSAHNSSTLLFFGRGLIYPLTVIAVSCRGSLVLNTCPDPNNIAHQSRFLVPSNKHCL